MLRRSDELDEPQPRCHRDARRRPHQDGGRKEDRPSVGDEGQQAEPAAAGTEDQPERRSTVRPDAADPRLGGDDRRHRDQEDHPGHEHGHRGHGRAQQHGKEAERQRRQPEHPERRRCDDTPEHRSSTTGDPEVGPDATPRAGHRLGHRHDHHRAHDDEDEVDEIGRDEAAPARIGPAGRPRAVLRRSRRT